MALDWLQDTRMSTDELAGLFEDYANGMPEKDLCEKYYLSLTVVNFYITEVYLGGIIKQPIRIIIPSKI